jgi:polyphenol oxidase
MSGINSAHQNQGLITYKLLSQFAELCHFTTTKPAFSKEGSRFTGISEKIKDQNLQVLSNLTGIEKQRFIFPVQTHSSTIKVVQSLNENNFPETDAMVTDQPGICICVQTADCVPVLLFDPGKKVIAVVHAGWRGTVGRIVSKTVRLMTEGFNSNPHEILAVIGPSIGSQVYEVGEDVISEIIKNIPLSEEVFTRISPQKSLLNLWVSNRNLLLEAGLKSGNIEIPGYCTYSETERFYSARRDGKHTGRQVSGMMLKL